MMDNTKLELRAADGEAVSIGHVPDGAWKFDADVARVFDDMLQRSIPQHDVMRKAVTEVVVAHQRKDRAILDLGCSRGEALAPLVDRFGAYNQFLGVDVSEPMLEAARARFRGMIAAGVVRIEHADIRNELPKTPPACATLLVLTLQFTPINYRQQILRRVFERTDPGGCVVLVEKVLGAGAELDDLFVRLYHGMKIANGYSPQEVERKRLSLEGVLVPVTAEWNAALLRGAGFRDVDCFWRWMNFAAWVGVK